MGKMRCGNIGRAGKKPEEMNEFDREGTIAYLQEAQALNWRIDAALERVQQLRALAERRTAAYGGVRVKSTPIADSRMDVVAMLVDEQRALDGQIARMISKQAEIAEVIGRVTDERMRTLLELRYLNGHTWEDIAERMNYTVRNIYNLHTAALRRVALARGEREEA